MSKAPRNVVGSFVGEGAGFKVRKMTYIKYASSLSQDHVDMTGLHIQIGVGNIDMDGICTYVLGIKPFRNCS